MALFEDETMGEIMGLLAHDLRNPLSALQSNIGFVAGARGGLSEDEQEALDDAAISCVGLAAIIDNMELMSHLFSGVTTRPAEVVPLRAFVQEVERRLKRTAQSHGVGFECEFPPGDWVVSAHRSSLAAAFANLVRNAIQHGSTQQPVRVLARREGGTIRLIVEDGGLPLDPSLGHSVYEATGQSRAKGKGGGRYSRGLGLFAAEIAARFAGAEISAEPLGKAGNRFILSCPVATGS